MIENFFFECKEFINSMMMNWRSLKKNMVLIMNFFFVLNENDDDSACDYKRKFCLLFDHFICFFSNQNEKTNKKNYHKKIIEADIIIIMCVCVFFLLKILDINFHFVSSVSFRCLGNIFFFVPHSFAIDNFFL